MIQIGFFFPLIIIVTRRIKNTHEFMNKLSVSGIGIVIFLSARIQTYYQCLTSQTYLSDLQEKPWITHRDDDEETQ
jgi:hypothetical protein